jgi:hypothetical protein
MADRPTVRVAVVMERLREPTRWEAWRHAVVEVVADTGGFGSEPRVLRDDGRVARWLHPGFEVALYADEGEGYYLNLTSGNPVWFVMWRVDDADPALARPEIVSVSYNEAGRWLDAQERVDNAALDAAVRDWLQAFTDANYRPEPKQRRRPQSFVRPQDRR